MEKFSDHKYYFAYNTHSSMIFTAYITRSSRNRIGFKYDFFCITLDI